MRVLFVPYATWSQVVDANGFTVYQTGAAESASLRWAWAGNRDFVFKTTADAGADLTDYQAKYETAGVDVLDEDDALARIVGLGKLPFAETTDRKKIVSVWPTEGDGPTLFSPDWCDPTTWYLNSTRVVDEAATSGDQLTYQIPNWSATRHLVDTYHGKISGEDDLKDSGGNSYRVEVKVDAGGGPALKTEQDPHVGSGGDYTIDYNAGTVTFLAALQPADVVTVTYHYVDRSAGDGSASEWVLAPAAGKILKIVKAEVQFSKDIVLQDTVLFQAYGLVEVFAPSLTPTPYPAGTKILIRTQKYKTMRDFYNDANGTYPELPALGGAGWRGMTQPTNTFPWVYQSMTDLTASYGMEVRIRLEHDIPFDGEFATATFYCLSITES